MLRKSFKKFWDSDWRNTLILVPLSVLDWYLYGRIISENFFDNHALVFKFIGQPNETLAYLGILFAIQIPVLILLLEQMRGAGYIRRYVLPRVIQFREVLISYLTLSFLIFVSPRQSYYYFPVIMLTCLSIFTVYEAVRVMFEQRKLRGKEDDYVRRLARSVYKQSLKGRIAINSFFEELKEQMYVSHSLLEYLDSDDVDSYQIRSTTDGTVSEVNVSKINELMVKEYYSDIQLSLSNGTLAQEDNSSVHDTPTAKAILEVRPGVNVKKQGNLLRLELKEGTEAPTKRLLASLQQCIKVNYSHPDASDKKFDELIQDFKQQMREAIQQDNTVQLDVSLSFYRQLTNELVVITETGEDEGYSFSEARNEFRRFYSDSISEKLEPIADILNDEYIHAVRLQHREAVKQMTGFIYRDILNVTHDFNTLTAARADQALISAMNQLIYSDTSIVEPKYGNEVFSSLGLRLKEHTGLLLYNYRKNDGNKRPTNDELYQWLAYRLNDSRGFLLSTYKRSALTKFKIVYEVFNEFESDYRMNDQEMRELILLSRCNLFVVAAYMHDRQNETEEQKSSREIIDEHLGKLSPQELTTLLVTCTDNDYADKWRVDTYDLIADGKMRNVPDFKMKLKSLWASYMLKKSSFPQDAASYDNSDDKLSKTPTFSDGLSKPEDAYLVKHLSDKNDQKSQNLLTLVEQFIELRNKWDNDRLVKQPLSRKKVGEFKAEINKGYKENAFMADAYKAAKKLSYVTRAPKGYMTYGWNQVREKAGYIDEWHIGYYMSGEDHGNEIANAENDYILSRLLSEPKKAKSINDWTSKITRNKKNKWLIVNVGTGSWLIRTQFEKYVEGNDYHKPVFKNVNQLMTTQFTYSDTLPKGLYAINVAGLGKLNIKGSKEIPVQVSVDAYSHNQQLLQGIISDPPEWLVKKGNKKQQEDFLKTMVRLLINHPFKFEPGKKVVAHYLPIDEDNF